ncbi:type II secretion system protein GspN [bacterium]|nr:type II secretion system protein GspN [bacterium]
MMYKISRSKKYFGYAFYSILLTFGLLFYRFPSDAYRDYFQVITNSINPQLLLLIEKIHPSFPFGLNLLQPTLSLKANPNIKVFVAENLLIRPNLRSLLNEESKYYFDCLAYDGDLKGNIRFEKTGTKTPFSTSIELKDICIDDFAQLSDLIEGNIRGILGGSITYGGNYNFLIDGIGEANLRISDGHVGLLYPILSFKSIDFDEMLIKMSLGNRTIDLASVELKGRVIHGALSGTVSLKKEVSQSLLNLKGTITFLASLDKRNKDASETLGRFLKKQKRNKLSFIIHGTLTEPRLRFI